MYEYHFRVRYSEADSTGKLSLMGLLALFQDTGYLHAHDRGAGLAFTKMTGETWFLLSWDIHTQRMPAVSEECCVRTWFYDMRGPYARKSLLLLDREGNTLATADTLWIYMDKEKGEAKNPPKGQFPPSDFDKRAETPAVARRRLRVPEGVEAQPSFVVTEEDVDTNGHVNNYRFALLACRVAHAHGALSLRAEYLHQAFLGQVLTPVVFEDDGTVVAMEDEDGTVVAAFWFGK